MTAVAIVGAQWGDEGKGKVVDLLAEHADAVVRYAGGPNAGHTLVVGNEKLVFRLVPSGVLHGHTECVLAQGMVINAAVLIEELDVLSARGLDLSERLTVSDRAHLILPYHVQLDELREGSAKGTKIGTTKRGIGPCYEDKIGRRGIRTGDLRDLARARLRIEEALDAWAPTARALGGELAGADQVCDELAAHAERLRPLLGDGSAAVERLVASGKKVMFEGAQGTMLDIDHGSYPYVTSSSAVAGGVTTGAGIGPTRIDRVVGITKAYTTRVGAGPFPTELDDAAGQHLRDVGGEYGSVTGRPRRTGWLDLPALRYARRVNGLDGLAITKLDVLSGLDELRVCVAYDTPQGRCDVLPSTDLADVTAVYETLPGWSDDITRCRTESELPAAVRSYLDFVREAVDVELYLVSVGPRRNETIVIRDAFA
jgi:adenylosuccinate synthase